MSNARKYSQHLDGKLNTSGKIIKLYRKQKNISRQELSNQLMIMGIDISSQSIYEIEVGNRGIMDFELCAIAKCLGITTDKLLKEFMEYLDNGFYE